MNTINILNFKKFRDYAYEHLDNSSTWCEALITAGYTSAVNTHDTKYGWLIALDDKDYFLFIFRWT